MSFLLESFGNTITSDLELVTGRWDIRGEVNFNTPIQDIRGAIKERPELTIGDFEAIGGYTQVPVEARQVGVEDRRWKQYAVWAADDDFLDASEFKLKLIADGYGPTEEQVWEALKEDAFLTVLEGYVVPTVRGDASEFTRFQLQEVSYEDERMAPVSIEVREPLTNVVIPLTVIGVLDRDHDPLEFGFGMLTSKSALDDEIPYSMGTSGPPANPASQFPGFTPRGNAVNLLAYLTSTSSNSYLTFSWASGAARSPADTLSGLPSRSSTSRMARSMASRTQALVAGRLGVGVGVRVRVARTVAVGSVVGVGVAVGVVSEPAAAGQGDGGHQGK